MKTNKKEHLLWGNVDKAIRQDLFPIHSNPRHELYVCLGGSAIDHIDGVEKNVRTGDVYVLESDCYHYQSDVKDFRCCVFQYYGYMFSEKTKGLRLEGKSGYKALFESGESCFVDSDTLRHIESLADIMIKETDADLLDAIFLSVVTLVCTKCKPRNLYGEDEVSSNLSEVLFYIEQNYDKRITLEDLSRVSNYSVRHFTRLMQDFCGKSPMEYLTSFRINKACEMLSYTTFSVSQISEKCGFDDNNLFSRRFRTIIGMSPTQYRRLNSRVDESNVAVSSVSIIEK